MDHHDDAFINGAVREVVVETNRNVLPDEITVR